MEKNKKKSCLSTKHGFGLIELMVVIAIIGILARIVYVNMSSVRVKTRDKTVYTQVISTQPFAYKCIRSGASGVVLNVGSTANDICNIAGFPKWPAFLAGSNWSYTNFGWCAVTSNLTTVPGTGAYADGTVGGDRTGGRFCYRISNGTKYIWCTHQGCAKSGF